MEVAVRIIRIVHTRTIKGINILKYNVVSCEIG